MRKGEKGILTIMAIVVGGLMINSAIKLKENKQQEAKIPFFTTASIELQREGMELIRKYKCRNCHTLWTVRDPMQAVPAPALDGIGSLKDESWLFEYLSAPNPQLMVPSRLKKEYQMPSYIEMSEQDRRILAKYLSSLKVEDWYLNEVKKAEYEKLTGKAKVNEIDEVRQ